MCRQRFNPNAICSSKNYKASKRVHRQYLRDTHEQREQEIKGMIFKIVNPTVVHHYGRPYLMVFGHKIPIYKDEVARAEEAGYAVHYE